MAATRLIPMHLQKSRSMGQCLKERTDYAKNDEKTEAGQFVSSYECDPSTVDLEFEITKISMRLTPEEIQKKRM